MSKLQRLRDNISAIECALKGENNAEVLGKYTGFGGLGFILNPRGDKSKWSKSDQQYYEDTERLHNLLIDNCKSECEFSMWWQSLKNSTLTAFYTPHLIPDAIFTAIYDWQNIGEARLLDPAAGMGVFPKLAKAVATWHGFSVVNAVCYEKDLLTGMMLKAMSDDGRTVVHTDGFETIPASELGTYDLVATNVPFADVKVYDPLFTSPVRKEALKMIHRYYVLKGLDCLREGGILAYIITSNYLNNDTEQVQEALKQARLIGAYRLANNLFKENGTEVGTDLLVLQKDSKRGELTEDEKLLLTQCTEEGCPNNYFFVEKYDHIMATGKRYDTDAYGKPGIVYVHDGGVQGIAEMLGMTLAEDMKSNCDAGLFGRVQTDLQSGCGEYKDLQSDKKRITNAYTQCDGIANPAEHGAIPAGKNGGRGTTAKGETGKEKLAKGILEAYMELEQYEREEQQENKELRESLNSRYDYFVKQYGLLHDAKNKKTIERVNKELLALEIKGEDGTWQKADIFFKPVAFSTGEPSRTLAAHEALAASLNKFGKPDMDYMQEVTGKNLEELLDELRGELFMDPVNRCLQIKAKYISGNVIEKLEQAEKAKQEIEMMGSNKLMPNEQTNAMKGLLLKEAQISIEALRAAIPTPIPFADLDFNLGERWIDTNLYQEFARDFFTVADTKDWQGKTVSGRPEITIRYEKSIDQYSVDWSGWGNEKIRTQYSVEAETGNKVDGIDLLTHALMDTTPKLMKYKRKASGIIEVDDDGNRKKEEDPEKMQMAKTKIDEIRQAFNDWLQRLPQERRDELADGYNRRFNCFVKPVYDGSHQTFPGLNYKGLTEKYGVKELYKSQKDCVWMLLQNGGGICDHEVGSGKTLIMVVTAHEMKRLGLAHKPMIIGLKANVSAIAETYRTAYPEAKVLFATEGDYSSANRVDFFNRMKTGDWDCVIMSHEQFGRIPQSMTVEREMAQELLQQCEDALEAVSHDRKVTKQMLKGLEKRKANLLAKISALNATLKEKKDDVVDFDQLGIDHILVDESHQFKNLGFVTRHDRVSGIGNVEGSQRAYNLKLALRTIQRKRNADLGATFLSGTTVTNSLTELYLLFDYLRPRALEKQGITCFDAWAAIFTKKSAEYEFSITNSIVLKERFRYFIKVPELAMFYNEITDYKTAEDVGIERPAKKPMLLKIKPTPDQEEYIKVLMEFAQNGDFSLIGIDNPTPQQEKAKMLYATDLARKMSMDMRLIDPCYGDHPDNKVSRCAQLIDRYYRAFDEMKGVQMVFSDLSTWDSSKWNVYAAIRDKLVDEYGIPKSEIRFIQEAKNDRQKQQIIDDANEGKVRVLFGSTSMLGTGVNAQKRVVAVHHLDTPWRPSDLEQRDGRAVRKGNEIARDYSDNTVDVIIYAVERSLDSYKFNLLHLKQVFISQLKRGQLNVRTLDEGAMDEKGGMNFAEYMAILSGNTDLLERAKMEKRIAALEGERKNFYRERHQTEEKRQWHKRDMERLCRSLDAAREDWQAFLSATGGARYNDITLHGFTVPDGSAVGSDDWTAAIGRELQRIDSTLLLAEDEVREIGTICGFPIQMKGKVHRRETLDGKQEELYQNVLSVRMPRLSWEGMNYGKLPRAGLRVSAEYPLQTVLRIEQSIRQWEMQAEQDRQTIDQLDAILTLEWGKEQQLTQLKADLQTLDRKIAKTVGKTEAEQQRIAAEADQKKPYTFDYERGEHKATFRRDAAPLVSIDEMREIAERNSDDHDWCRSVSVRNWNYGSYREERKKSGPDVEIESRQGDRCERTVLDIFALQAKREKDQAWLRAKAAEDTRGTEVYQDNEVIFAARKLMKQAA